MKMNIPYRYLPLLLMLFIVACSTTSRLGEDETLYNGMKVKINPTGGEKLPDALVS